MIPEKPLGQFIDDAKIKLLEPLAKKSSMKMLLPYTSFSPRTVDNTTDSTIASLRRTMIAY